MRMGVYEELNICEKTFIDNGRYYYIDRNGFIYPSCRTYIDKPICNLKDGNRDEAITLFMRKLDSLRRENGYEISEPRSTTFDLLTIEFSSKCHAKCLYCFQRDGRLAEYDCFRELGDFLSRVTTSELFFSGGELLDQPKAIGFIADYRAKTEQRPWMHLKTNGHFGKEQAHIVGELFDSTMVTFNGFSDATIKTIMGVDRIARTLEFCETIVDQRGCNLGVKYLNSPMALVETNSFLLWAIRLSPLSIVLQTAYHYSFDASGNCKRHGTVFDGLDSSYWEQALSRVAREMDKILTNSTMTINNGSNYLFTDKEFLDLMPLSGESVGLFDTSGIYRIH